MLTEEVTGDAAVALQVGHHRRAVVVVTVGCTASLETRRRRSVSPPSSQHVRELLTSRGGGRGRMHVRASVWGDRLAAM